MMCRRMARSLVVVPLSVALFACAGDVKPWERGTLAKREMAISPNPSLRKLRDHVFVSKEAAQGGSGGSAAGCGCN
jgi:hypothetical protein